MNKFKNRGFFFYVFSTFTGLFLFFTLLILLLFGIFLSSVAKKSSPPSSKSPVLELKLNGEINDYTPESDLQLTAYLGDEFASPLSLNNILKAIDLAKHDSAIKCIYLNVNFLNAGYSTLTEIYYALHEFKKSGKKVIAFADFYYNKNYFLASVADSIFLHPKGEFILNGMSANTLFIKDLLQKVGVEMQVVRVGDFKGAVEPLVRNSLSEENKSQIASFLNLNYQYFINRIAEGRKMSRDNLKNICDNLLAESPTKAEELNLIDGLIYPDELFEKLNAFGKQKDNKYKQVSAYIKQKNADQEGNDEIALVFAEGNIVSGKGNTTNIGGKKYAEILRKIRKGKNVKALVLRVNSGGGSAFASDEILREIKLIREKNIPVVVSFGNVAASGGYYISCLADSIFSLPNTLTGSIGVFGVYPNAKKLLNDKIGIKQEVIKTGKFSDFGRIDRPLNLAEKKWINQRLLNIYDDFVAYVAEGRDMKLTNVYDLAQGKIYSGSHALESGLVDKLGGLQMAMESAIKMSKSTSPKTIVYPKAENEISILLDKIGLKSYVYQKQFSDLMQTKRTIDKFSKGNALLDNCQMGLPFDLQIE